MRSEFASRSNTMAAWGHPRRFGCIAATAASPVNARLGMTLRADAVEKVGFSDGVEVPR
jgi:hypothetical protein